MKRNYFSRLGTAALVCALAVQLCVPALADMASGSAGDGTIYIGDTDALTALASQCAYDAWSQGKTVVLQRDIDLGGVDFRPIPSFGGVFEGGGHTISGLNVASDVSPAGLFGAVTEAGVVRELRVEGSVAPSGSGDAVGGVVGINRGTLEDCSFTGTVQGETRTGGVVGVNEAGGVVRRCGTDGGVFGKNMTGGVVGENRGTVTDCANRAYVNTNTLDPTLSFEKLDLSLTGTLDSLTSPDTYNATVDSGGVAGFSDGTILSCQNYGGVGYQHIGYNVGGVAGRSSGHIATCTNAGTVYGRREVGGVVGMAEPHVKLNLTDASLTSVRQALNALSDAVDKTVADAEGSTGTLSARLSVVSGSVSTAETRAQQLTDSLASSYNDAASELNRGSEILDNTIRQLDAATRGLVSAASMATDALADINAAADAANDGAGGSLFEELQDAADETKSAADRINSGAAEMREGLDTLRGSLTDGKIDPSVPLRGIAQIRDGYAKTKPALGEVDSAVDHLSNAMASAGDASEHLEDATRSLETSSRELTQALDDTEALLGYLDTQEQFSFQPIGAKTESDALYDSLRGVSNNLDALNRETRASSELVLWDVRLINQQFNALMNLLLDTAEDAQGYTPTAIVEDTSDEDIDAVIAGKILLCSNGGAVSGDIDVGGVAGAMLVYNALDPERDADASSSLLRRRYELKCVLERCNNTGDVSARRENVGAVCGSATLGVVRGCVGCGTVTSENGDYVGGVAGYGDSILRRCWAKCSLSGARYVGGIVGGTRAEGTGLRVEDCRSLVEITDGTQYCGAIGGGTEGTFRGNRFVSDTLAGIDRVSYAGRAEPTDYETLVSEEDAPAAMRGFTLRFLAGEQVVKTVPFRYGDSFDASVFPAIPAEDGKYARWDRDELDALYFDTTVRAVYTTQLTALGSAFTRSAARSAFFVEGAFGDGAAFAAEPAIFDFSAGSEGAWRILRSWRRSILEQWTLSMPDGETHTLRYLPPEGVSGSLSLYVRGADGRWTAAEHGAMGSYLTFDAAGETVELTVVSASTPWWLWTLLIVFLLGAAVLAGELLLHRKPKTSKLTKQQRTKLRRILIAAVAALGLTVGAAVKLAPRISESMGLYRLVRNYAERGDLDMSLSLEAELNGKPLAADLTLYLTQCEGKTVSCVQWDDVPVWFCDGAMLLENGKAYRAEGAMADYSSLLGHAAGLYRAVDVSVREENGVKTYHAEAQGEDARRVLSILLPQSAELLPDSEHVGLDLVVTDGELTSLLTTWHSGEQRVTAELRMLDTEGAHILPQPVRAAIASGSAADAPEVGEDLRALLLAWTEGSSRETLTADVSLKANCGPLLVDEALMWQRSRAYSGTLSCLSRRGSTIYYTDAAACTGGGLVLSRSEAAYSGTSQLLRLACRALLLGEAECTELSNGRRYNVVLDADAMAEFASLVAPDSRALSLSLTDGTVRLELRGGMLSALSLRVGGSVRVVRADIPASLSAQLDFDPDAAFRAPSSAVLSALELSER